MKVNAKYLKRLFNDKHQSEITFLVENFQQQRYLNDLSNDIEYTIEIKEVKQKRSIAQNKLLWVLLNELEKVSKQDMMIWYCHALEETNCSFEYLMGLEGIETHLKNAFRAVKKVAPRMVDGKEVMVYKCFYGSSRYTVAEMTELIETVMRYCAELGIDTENYKYE